MPKLDKTTLRAVVTEGHMLRFPNQAFLRQQISGFKVGNVVWVTIDAHAPKRSELQNNYYWLCLTAISESTGHDKDMLHGFFKKKFLPEQQITLGKETLGVSPTTTKLNKSDFTEYMMNISAFVADLGIILPDPAELEGSNTWLKQNIPQ